MKNRLDCWGAASLTSLELEGNKIRAAGEALILEMARANPSFVTKIDGFSNFAEINAAVWSNLEKNLVKQAKIGALILVDE